MAENNDNSPNPYLTEQDFSHLANLIRTHGKKSLSGFQRRMMRDDDVTPEEITEYFPPVQRSNAWKNATPAYIKSLHNMLPSAQDTPQEIERRKKNAYQYLRKQLEGGMLSDEEVQAYRDGAARDGMVMDD